MSQAVVQYVMILSVSRASNFPNLLAPRATGFRSLMSSPGLPREGPTNAVPKGRSYQLYQGPTQEKILPTVYLREDPTNGLPKESPTNGPTQGGNPHPDPGSKESPNPGSYQQLQATQYPTDDPDITYFRNKFPTVLSQTEL